MAPFFVTDILWNVTCNMVSILNGGYDMCNQNSCFGGNCCWIIIAIIILFLFCGNNGICGCNDVQNTGCGCGCN